MKTRNFTTSTDRLSLDRLKHPRGRRISGTQMRRDAQNEQAEETFPVKDLIANLLVPEKDAGADFERAFVKRGAKRFAEWIEKELEK